MMFSWEKKDKYFHFFLASHMLKASNLLAVALKLILSKDLHPNRFVFLSTDPVKYTNALIAQVELQQLAGLPFNLAKFIKPSLKAQ